jgi:hypothetical protein
MVPELGSAGGGPQNCAFQPDRLGSAGIFQRCFDNAAVTHNMVVGGADWPRGNITVRDAGAAGIRDPNKAPGWYRLCRQKEEGCKKASPAIGAASDGKDMGADVEKIEKAMDEVK